MRTPGEVIGIVIIAVLLTLTIVGALTGSSLLDGGSDPLRLQGVQLLMGWGQVRHNIVEGRPQAPYKPEEVPTVTVPPEHAGQLPTTLYAVVQSGVYDDQRRHTIVELSTKKAAFDRAAEIVHELGSPKIKYMGHIGTIQWQASEQILPDCVPQQQGLL